MDKWPRLHAEWIVVPVQLQLGLALRDTTYPSNQSTFVFIFDGETELPVGGWITGDKPGTQDVGLALYQAIWHVGLVDWPLRGIGRRIRISQKLLDGGKDELHCAARFLQTAIDTETTSPLQGKRQAIALIEALRNEGVAAIHSIYENQRPTTQQALQELLLWIHQHVFTGHRTLPVQPAIREHRVGMPGYNTQAAGWLLPRVGVGRADEHGVWFQERLYRHATWQPATADQALQCRGLPIDMPMTEGTSLPSRRWIFAEIQAESMTRLVHLEEV